MQCVKPEKLGFWAVLCLVSLAGCGGGGEAEKGSLSAVAACDPAGAPVGEKITCRVSEDFKDDCTVFFGSSPLESWDKAVEGTYVYDEAAGTISLIVPPVVSKTQDISYCCGTCDERSSIAKGFTVGSKDAKSPAEDKPAEDEAPAAPAGTTPAGGGDEEVLPGAGAPVPGGSGGDATADTDGDGVADVLDACPGTVHGAGVNGVGCSAAQLPQPAAATITTFTVTKAADPGAKISTYRIRFNYANAKSAHLWGNVFNRDASDGALPEGQRCGKVAGRYLLTKSDGSNWAGNEPDFTNASKNIGAFATGVLCDGSNPDNPKGCKHEPAAYAPEANPDCRIDLKKASGTLVTSDTLYTRSLVEDGTACLAVKGQNDAWKIQCVNVEAAEPTVTVEVAAGTSPELKLTIDYAGAVAEPSVTWKEPGHASASCVKNAGASSGPDSRGIGHYEGTCLLAERADFKTDIEVSVRGIGPSNKVEKRLRFAMGAQTLDFDFSDPWTHNADCSQSGDTIINKPCSIEMRWKLKGGAYTVKDLDSGQTLETGKAHWVKNIKFYYAGESTPIKTVTPPAGVGQDEVGGVVTVSRNYEHTSWKAVAKDVAGDQFASITRTKDYPASFHAVSGSWGGTCHTRTTCTYIWPCASDCSEPGRYCTWDVDHHYSSTDYQISFQGQHLKKIEVDCPDGLNKQPDSSNYHVQTFTLNANASDRNLTCTFRGIGHDGSVITRTSSWTCD